MSIKNLLVRLAEKITGRKCTRCLHDCKGRCCHPDGRMFMRCWQSITRPGFEKRPPRYLKPGTDLNKEVQAPDRYVAQAGMEVKPAPLTPEQEHQLAKIRTMLQEAEDEARESGLLTED
jgi:hypothetical protein